MIKPASLKKGDTAAVVSLSRGMLGEKMFIHKFYLAKQRMEDMGLKVKVMPNALNGIEDLYRHPEKRWEDWKAALLDDEVKAIFCAIGGDDTIRLLPYVDFDLLRSHPKIFTGFSDTTTNHFMMHKAGVVSYYGLSVMNNWAEYVAINPYTKEAVDKMLFHPAAPLEIPCSDFCSFDEDKIWWGEEHMLEATPRFPNTGYEILQGQGKAEGELMGGCIDVFPELLGTSLWPSLEDWKGKILLLETSENNMSEDMLTWLLRNLWAQGIFDVISGIAVGKPAFRDKMETYKEVYRKVVGFEAGKKDLPILYNVNAGHAYPTGLFPLGLSYEIDCEKKTFTLLEKAAES